ncbi:MAG: bifunctional hydroxymethylpyrimidine kinase/phosphomethylpyrimidine kinase [Actinomycetota bacterium]
MSANTAPPRPRALSIAGSDSGGGAGIQADLKTFSALGVYGMTAITAITVQNTKGVYGYEALSPQLVEEQIRAVTTDIGVDAAKTGMLANGGIVRAVAAAVEELEIPNLVVDPVFVSKHGHLLLAEDAIDEIRSRILPLATLVTPNLPEASGLSSVQVDAKDNMRRAADAILAMGASAVLIKGGHLEASTEAADLFVSGGVEEWLATDRIDTPNTHGTGCTLSSAIVAHLAMGWNLLEAVRAGKAFVTEAIRHGLEIGEGIGPVDQLWSIRPIDRR